MFEVHILSIIGINLDVKKNKLDGMEISARKKNLIQKIKWKPTQTKKISNWTRQNTNIEYILNYYI